MQSTINLNRLIRSKNNATSVLTDGGQQSGNEYIPGTRYTGYLSVNGHGLYRQDVVPEVVYVGGRSYKTAEGHGYMDITNRDDYKSLLHERVFVQAKKFPFDISLNYKGGDKLSLFVLKNDNNELEVHAYKAQYMRPFIKCRNMVLGNSLDSGQRALYALDGNSEILAVVVPWLLRVDSPLQSFIIEAATSWFLNGDETLDNFESDLQAAIQRSKQYFDKINKDRVEAAERARLQRRVEEEVKEAARIGILIKNIRVPETEISGEDLIGIARSLGIELHPRTVGSIRKRICKIVISENGFGMSFYRGKGGTGLSGGVKAAVQRIICVAKCQELGNTKIN